MYSFRGGKELKFATISSVGIPSNGLGCDVRRYVRRCLDVKLLKVNWA